jgi:hypothetical protein
MVASEEPMEGRCGAAPRKNGPRTWPCKKYPMAGEKRCKLHGGKHSQGVRTRHKQELRDKVDKAIRQLKITPVEDPLTALKTLAGEVLAWKDEMSRHVHQLTSIRYTGEAAEQIRGEVQLFEKALDRCTTVLATIAKLNIDDRLAAITERQAQVLTNGLFAAFDEAGFGIVDVEKKKAVAAIFGRHLRLVA